MKIVNMQANNAYTNMSKKKNTEDSTSSKEGNVKNGVLYAGELNLNTDVQNKKLQAQKKALKTIMDQFKNELNSDDNLSSLKTQQSKYSKDIEDAKNEITNLENCKEDLKDTYGVTDDSSEHKNLKLLEKSLFNPTDLTEDEYKQLKDIGPLTDYQKEALKYDAAEYIYRKRVDSAANVVMSINKSIDSMKLEKLKTHPMVEAQEEALKIIKEASKEVYNMLMQDVKENFDEKMEEQKEEAQKKLEEEEKKEKQTEKAKADSDNSTNNTNSTDSQTLDTSISMSDQQELVDNVKRVAVQEKMLDEDIKGIVVDEQV